MVKVCKNGVWILKAREIIEDSPENQNKLKKLPSPAGGDLREIGRRGTLAARVLLTHDLNRASSRPLPKELKLTFDALVSHGTTFADAVKAAGLNGLEGFPVPCVVAGAPLLPAAGGVTYVPPHAAGIHSYIRENVAASGKMILGSRCGALGAMGVSGEGALVKQLLRQTCDIPWPRIIAVYLTGKPRRGSGPLDIALAITAAAQEGGFARDAVLEFLGDGIAELRAGFRLNVDALTAETGSWSSIWETDETTRHYFAAHGREGDYKKLQPSALAYYDGMIYLDLSAVKPMTALPFGGGIIELGALLANPGDILRHVEKEGAGAGLTDAVDSQGRIRVGRAALATCAGGTFDNLMAVCSVLENRAYRHEPGSGFTLSLYPASQPVLIELARNGALVSLISRGALVCTVCGPCSEPPAPGLSVRHGMPDGAAFLLDARSIAATALNRGCLSSIESITWEERIAPYSFDPAPYFAAVYGGRRR